MMVRKKRLSRFQIVMIISEEMESHRFFTSGRRARARGNDHGLSLSR